MASFSENEKQIQEKALAMLDEVVKLYRNARVCLEKYDYKSADRHLDAAKRIIDDITTLGRGRRD